ncbi:MAG: hypothetical protein U9P79_10235, partial [Candidatus Cloacimonadota bacterium]|nr:hypothetical protein [Candidatus Cloacimonadota bacterium]
MKKIYFSKINNLAKIAEASEILENDGILMDTFSNKNYIHGKLTPKPPLLKKEGAVPLLFEEKGLGG